MKMLALVICLLAIFSIGAVICFKAGFAEGSKQHKGGDAVAIGNGSWAKGGDGGGSGGGRGDGDRP